ncbi:triose-phosphate isomerase [Candidatus Woesearchaeota archaeon]|nr:triose-phosphate isomerase [Candidatus Woesearchaeota archaeon]
MRKKIVVANWKMNKTVHEAVSFANEINKYQDFRCDVALCAPFVALSELRNVLDKRFHVGAQNIYFEEAGAYTGEISATMIKKFCRFVIVGHSERRQIFKEDDQVVNKKAKIALKHGITPIVCIGETLQERESGKTSEVVQRQILESLKDIDVTQIIMAYEPVWAIGTGRNATPEQAEEIHALIRRLIGSEKTRILYGGSVKPENAKGLMQQKNIDGALVGGASLDVKSFIGICQNA